MTRPLSVAVVARAREAQRHSVFGMVVMALASAIGVLALVVAPATDEPIAVAAVGAAILLFAVMFLGHAWPTALPRTLSANRFRAKSTAIEFGVKRWFVVVFGVVPLLMIVAVFAFSPSLGRTDDGDLETRAWIFLPAMVVGALVAVLGGRQTRITREGISVQGRSLGMSYRTFVADPHDLRIVTIDFRGIKRVELDFDGALVVDQRPLGKLSGRPDRIAVPRVRGVDYVSLLTQIQEILGVEIAVQPGR